MCLRPCLFTRTASLVSPAFSDRDEALDQLYEDHVGGVSHRDAKSHSACHTVQIIADRINSSHVSNGVRQGGVLSPLWFNLCIHYMSGCRFLMFFIILQ